MSASLYWMPAVDAMRRVRGNDSELRRALGRRHFDSDGTLAGRTTLDNTDREWLEGVRDAGVEGAQELIDAIKRHGSIVVEIAH